ncbi:hypothetical protein TNCV_4830651 [Trichonephila clavipes]|nr:hypothetical protein TNCV_4830651 [Trichonephila clavipes]
MPRKKDTPKSHQFLLAIPGIQQNPLKRASFPGKQKPKHFPVKNALGLKILTLFSQEDLSATDLLLRTKKSRLASFKKYRHKILRNQYPEQPTVPVITAFIRMGIESNRDWMAHAAPTGTDTHAASTRCHSSSNVVTNA